MPSEYVAVIGGAGDRDAAVSAPVPSLRLLYATAEHGLVLGAYEPPAPTYYTVRFLNGTIVLQTEQVASGGTATYTGAMPTSSDPSMVFAGWDHPLANITSDTDIHAMFEAAVELVVPYVGGTMTDYESDTATVVAEYAFAYMTTLATAKTSATTIGSRAFYSCTSLTTVDLTGTGATSIEAYAFNGCSELDTLVIRSQSVCSLSSTNALSNTKVASGTGKVYVPASLVSSYQADSKWSSYTIDSIGNLPTP